MLNGWQIAFERSRGHESTMRAQSTRISLSNAMLTAPYLGRRRTTRVPHPVCHRKPCAVTGCAAGLLTGPR